MSETYEAYLERRRSNPNPATPLMSKAQWRANERAIKKALAELRESVDAQIAICRSAGWSDERIAKRLKAAFEFVMGHPLF